MNWLKRLFQRESLHADLDRELQFHLEEITRENIARGMSEEEARRQAVLEFGGPQQCREELRDIYRVRLLDTFLSNLRFALRMLRKAPGFSAAILLTLTLGIGANSAVFSAIDSILLRPLPFPHGDQLMVVEQRNKEGASAQAFVAPVRLEDWNRLNSTFQAISGYFTEEGSETSGSLPERLTQAYVTPRFLQVWGVGPALGRDFLPEEHKFGGSQAAIISGAFSRRRFGTASSAIGQKLHFGSMMFTIVGVMPESFRFPVHEVDVWVPVPADAPYAQSRASTWYSAVGRLKPGVSLAQARSDLALVQSRLGAQFPETDAKLDAIVLPLKEQTVGGSKQSLWLLFGSVSLLLLIACTNIASLLLARVTQRSHEIAVRFSLGASRGHVIGQLLTEVFVLAMVGALAGLGVAAGAVRVFRAMAGSLPRVDEVALDWRIVLYTFGCAVVVTLLCGVVPALRATRSRLSSTLAENSRTQVSARHPLQWALVGVQVALAVTLLLAASLLLRSFQALARVSPGFEIDHVLALQVSGSWGETTDMKKLTRRIDRTLERFRSIPGVEDATTSNVLPGVPNKFPTEINLVEGEADPNRKVVVDARFVSRGYFNTMQIPLLAGETCRDNPDTTDVVVNRSFVSSVFGERNVLGHHLESTQVRVTGVVRGIVADAREQGINSEPEPTVYWCVSAPTPDPHYLVRTGGSPATIVTSLRQALREIEPSRALFNVVPLRDELSEAFSENRLRTILLTLFAATAVSLACIGLYGTLSYLVNLRRREVGLRLALGEKPQKITLRFLRQGLLVCLGGCFGGMALAMASNRMLENMLYGISRNDPATAVMVLGLVVMVSGIAALVPALRASRTDPMSVLREG